MKKFSIVIVDDDEVDIIGITRALRKKGIANQIFSVNDGVEALALLRGESGPKPPAPHLMLIDINMPRMNGIELLKELRADEELSSAIAFVLSTSDDDQDILAAYEQNVAGYVVKSNVGEEFIRLVTLIDQFRLTVHFPEE